MKREFSVQFIGEKFPFSLCRLLSPKSQKPSHPRRTVVQQPASQPAASFSSLFPKRKSFLIRLMVSWWEFVRGSRKKEKKLPKLLPNQKSNFRYRLQFAACCRQQAAGSRTVRPITTDLVLMACESDKSAQPQDRMNCAKMHDFNGGCPTSVGRTVGRCHRAYDRFGSVKVWYSFPLYVGWLVGWARENSCLQIGRTSFSIIICLSFLNVCVIG